jgi:3-oxoacyl-[acyl-carrier protein] reductase
VITFDYTDKVVLVTGASAGIGLSIAEQFLQAGARVMLNGSTQEKLDRATEGLGALAEKAVAFRANVGDAREVETMFQALLERWGRIDVLVNNAGVYPSVLVTEMSEEEWDRVLDTNLKGAFLTARLAGRQMIGQGGGGKIVNIASGSWKIARVGSAAYCASKAGMVMLTAVLSQELGPHRINVNCVAPGLIDVWDTATHGRTPYHEATVRMTPWGRMGTPEDIAHMVLMLCSPQAEYVTGAVVGVDGGLSVGRYGIPVSV